MSSQSNLRIPTSHFIKDLFRSPLRARELPCWLEFPLIQRVLSTLLDTRLLPARLTKRDPSNFSPKPESSFQENREVNNLKRENQEARAKDKDNPERINLKRKRMMIKRKDLKDQEETTRTTREIGTKKDLPRLINQRKTDVSNKI